MDANLKKHKRVINSGVYFVTLAKNNGNTTLQIFKTENIEEDNKNKVITHIFRVDRPNDFYEFLVKHPSLIKTVNEEGNYVLSADELKKLIFLCNRQHKYYVDLIETDIPVSIKHININRGNKIQKYSETGELLKTYIGIREATRQESISDTTLKNAIQNKTIYCGYRWMYLDRSLPDDTVQDIGESIKVNTPKNAFVAMLDIDKTRIVAVYQNQKSAAIARKLKSSSAIYQSIMKGNLSSGHYFKYYEDCTDDLKRDFLNSGGILPEMHINRGVSVKQVHHITGEIIKEYPSILDVQKHFQISSKCIKKAIETGEIVKGFRWKTSVDNNLVERLMMDLAAINLR